jgi:hypothetical protein
MAGGHFRDMKSTFMAAVGHNNLKLFRSMVMREGKSFINTAYIMLKPAAVASDSKPQEHWQASDEPT